MGKVSIYPNKNWSWCSTRIDSLGARTGLAIDSLRTTSRLVKLDGSVRRVRVRIKPLLWNAAKDCAFLIADAEGVWEPVDAV
jgi:hypothetical protein